MIRRWTAAIFLLTTPVWATEQAPAAKDNVDIGGLLGVGKKPCDGDKQKTDQAAADDKNKTGQAAADDKNKTDQAALAGLLGQPSAEKKPEPAQKSLGAVPAMGNCK